jgi:hypothetical protein
MDKSVAGSDFYFVVLTGPSLLNKAKPRASFFEFVHSSFVEIFSIPTIVRRNTSIDNSITFDVM